MATDFYKAGGSYYEAGSNKKILNPNELRQYAVAGGKEIAAPAIARSGADILTTTASGNTTGLDQWKSGANLVEAARSIIQMKQGYNKDIQTAKQVWTEKARSTGPWEGDQTIFSGMSPQNQAAIRAKQYATAEAHLSGLSDEEKYRATRTEDTLKYVSDIYDEKIKQLEFEQKKADDTTKNALDARRIAMEEQRNRILSAKDLADAGLPYQFDPVTGDIKYDWSGVTTQQIVDSIKNVESGGDYNAKGKSGEFGAYQFMPRTWDAWSGEFTQATKGQAQTLVPTPANQDAVATWKIEQLQKQGYTPDQIASIWNSGSPDYAGKTGTNSQGVKYDVPGYVKKVTANLMSGSPTGKVVKLTQAEKANLMQESGLSNADVKSYTPDDWINLKNTIHEATLEHAATALDSWKKQITVRGSVVDNPSPDLVRSQLTLNYPTLSSSELDAVMQQAGYTLSQGLLGSKWSAPSSS